VLLSCSWHTCRHGTILLHYSCQALVKAVIESIEATQQGEVRRLKAWYQAKLGAHARLSKWIRWAVPKPEDPSVPHGNVTTSAIESAYDIGARTLQLARLIRDIEGSEGVSIDASDYHEFLQWVRKPLPPLY